MENTVAVQNDNNKIEKRLEEYEKQIKMIFQQTSQALNNQVVLGKQIQIIQQQLQTLLAHNGLVTQATKEKA